MKFERLITLKDNCSPNLEILRKVMEFYNYAISKKYNIDFFPGESGEVLVNFWNDELKVDYEVIFEVDNTILLVNRRKGGEAKKVTSVQLMKL